MRCGWGRRSRPSSGQMEFQGILIRCGLSSEHFHTYRCALRSRLPSDAAAYTWRSPSSLGSLSGHRRSRPCPFVPDLSHRGPFETLRAASAGPRMSLGLSSWAQ